MQFEIFLHGTPQGQQILGKSSDAFARFASTFYTVDTADITEKLRMDQLVASRGSVLIYSLVWARQIVGDDGREGGYVALSLQLDLMARSTYQIYNLLKALFLTKVLGRIVRVKEGDKIQFATSKLTSFGVDYIAELEGFVGAYIRDNIGASGFAPIPQVGQSGKVHSGGVRKVNRFDFSENLLLQTLANGDTLDVSDEYPSQLTEQKIRDLSRQLEETKRSYSMQLAELQEQHRETLTAWKQQWNAKLEQSSEQLRQQAQKSKVQLDQLAMERNQLRTELEHLQIRVKTADLQSSLLKQESSLKALAESIFQLFGLSKGGLSPSQEDSSTSDKVLISHRSWFPIIHLILTLICALLLTVVLIFFRSDKGDNTPPIVTIQHDTVYIESPRVDSTALEVSGISKY